MSETLLSPEQIEALAQIGRAYVAAVKNVTEALEVLAQRMMEGMTPLLAFAEAFYEGEPCPQCGWWRLKYDVCHSHECHALRLRLRRRQTRKRS